MTNTDRRYSVLFRYSVTSAWTVLDGFDTDDVQIAFTAAHMFQEGRSTVVDVRVWDNHNSRWVD